MEEFIELEDIKENLAVIKLTKSYRSDLARDELYDLTRGAWVCKLERAMKADYVLSVHDSIVMEVYKADDWVPAKELDRSPELRKGDLQETRRIGFNGKIADDEVRDRYLGKSVKKLFKPGNAHPIMIFDKYQG